MPTDADLFRLLRSAMRFIDRHAEVKEGSGVLSVPLLPHEMREFRRALEPFRDRYRELESLSRLRVEEITGKSLATGDEIAIWEALCKAIAG